MSEHVKIIFGSEETNMHHDLDIHPIPEKALYINDLTIADTCKSDFTQVAPNIQSHGKP